MIIGINDLTPDLLKRVHSIFAEEPGGHTVAVWDANRLPAFVGSTSTSPVMQVASIMVAAIDADTLAAICAKLVAIDPQGSRRIIQNSVPAERAHGF